MFSQPNIFIKTSPSWYVCNSWIFYNLCDENVKSVSPLTVFSLVQNFNWHLLKPVIPRRGEIRGQECNLFFLRDRRFHWLIDWIFWVWGWGVGGREGGDCKFEMRETRSSIPVRNLIKYPTEAWWSRQGTLPFLLCICWIDKLREILLF